MTHSHQHHPDSLRRAQAGQELVEFTAKEIQTIDRSIPDQFEKIVSRYPDRLAVKMGEHSLTYCGLNRCANRIARAILDKRGPGSEPIALLFEHGIDLIAAILGVLKAGKFYVALDPSFPIARMNLIVEDAQVKLIVTNDRNYVCARHCPGLSDVILNIDEMDSSGVDNLGISVSPDWIASIMYTSGSTGAPKGVVDTHSNVLESSRYLAEMIRLCVDDRLSLLHTFSYASARTSAYLSLLNGASLFPFDLQRRGAEHLAAWVSRERLTVLYCPIALFRRFANLLTEAIPLSSLRILHLSGAPITRTDFELYKKRFHDGVALEISMGSTEARGIGIAVLNKQFSFPSEGTPVGYAPPGKEILILDATHRTLPQGEVGEIAIRGKNLNPGYWRLPELTQSKYLPDPDGGDKRIYLTGDLGKMLPEGFLVHMGRKDLMVKIRGYRVDLSEVEGALLEHPGVKEAAVAACDREPGEKYLTGYIVRHQESAPDVSELREFLTCKLPDYMIPSTFTFLASLPLMNGKLHRQELPKPDKRRPELKEPYVAPRNDIERKLAGIWAEVLLINAVGVEDNFFDLGGHSLAGARIITRVQEEFGAEMSVSNLLDSPTVAELAECIGGRRNASVTLQPARETEAIDSVQMLDVPRGKGFIRFPKDDVESSIPKRFEKIARLYPDNIAVKVGDQTVNYSELNIMANRIARTILGRRGSTSKPIGMLLDKGVEQIATMLGVLKAGAFFVLLDPSWPNARIANVLEDARTDLVVTDQHNEPLAHELTHTNDGLMRIESIDSNLPCDDPSLEISPTALAYLVYTSGSTGEPKGIVQSHQNLLHRIMLYTNTTLVHIDDRLACLPAGTSNTVTNIFLGILSGAELLPFDVKKEGVSRLVAWLVKEKITYLRISSPLFRNLCDVVTEKKTLSSLRLLHLTSDTVYKTDVDLYKRCVPSGCVLFVGLSSSEAGPQRRYFINHETVIAGTEVPVGYPVEDKEILLLDDNGKPVGFNEVGEIVVRSKYLSLGYWNREDLTASKFSPDPAGAEKRLYYTADLGLMLPNGCLFHKGRKDWRVKIRGYGVDLTEVKKHLCRHAAINDSVVVSRKDNSGEMGLVAYFTASTQPAPTASELREFLLETLPDYMIPTVFVKIEAMPLTPNGKVDRKALPEPRQARPELNVSYVAPRSPTEQKLAEIWTKVLSVGQVGIYDDFFDLGGHSLSGSRLVSLLHETFHVDLPVSEFFAAPTIAQLARRITEGATKAKAQSGKKAWTYLCEIQKGTGLKPVFVFPGGGGGEPEFFVYGFLARHVGTEYPFYGLRARGADGILQRHTSVPQMADAYVEEIRAMQPEGPYFLVGECAGGVNAYEAARQLLAQGQEVAMLALMDVERPTFIKYLRFRANQRLRPIAELWRDTGGKWLRENYIIARLPYHLRQIGSLPIHGYPRYITGRFRSALKPPQRRAQTQDTREAKAVAVLRSTASGKALHHIERVRENYRRTVRRFRPKPYHGNIDIIVSEKLHRHDPTLGWKKLALKGLRIHPMPGDHWSYIRDHVTAAGLKLRECLERAKQRQAPPRPETED